MLEDFKDRWGDRKTGLKVGRNTCHTHTHTLSLALSFFLIKKAKNGDSEVIGAGRGG